MFFKTALFLLVGLTTAFAVADEEPKPKQNQKNQEAIAELKANLIKAETALKVEHINLAKAEAVAIQQRQLADEARKVAEVERDRALAALEELKRQKAIAEQQRLEALKQAQLAKHAEAAARQRAEAALQKAKAEAALQKAKAEADQKQKERPKRAKKGKRHKKAGRRQHTAKLAKHVMKLAEHMRHMQAEIEELRAIINADRAKTSEAQKEAILQKEKAEQQAKLAQEALLESHRRTDRAEKDLERYAQLIAASPDDSALYMNRAAVYVRLQNWQKAADDFADAIQLTPDNQWIWHLRTSLLLELGRTVELKEHCQDMLKRFADTTDATIARRTAHCLVYAPGLVDNLEKVRELAQKSASNDPFGTFSLTMGMICYRQNKYDEALQWVAKSAEKRTTLHCYIITRLVLAALHYQNDDLPQAKRWLTAAKDAAGPWLVAEKPVLSSAWNDELFCRAIYREVVTLVNGPQLFPNNGFVRSPGPIKAMAYPLDAVIRYTTDGTSPSESSPKYTNPVFLNENSVLKFRVFFPSGKPSGVSSVEVDPNPR